MTQSSADRHRRSALLASGDAAAALGVSQATLRDWVRLGLLSNHGSRRQALYDPQELAVALDAPKPRRVRDTPPNTRTA